MPMLSSNWVTRPDFACEFREINDHFRPTLSHFLLGGNTNEPPCNIVEHRGRPACVPLEQIGRELRTNNPNGYATSAKV
jgi:hypothetical protein